MTWSLGAASLKKMNAMNKPLAAIILAAGKGTRMESKLPKVLHAVGGKSMIIHVIQTARSLGANKIIAVLGYKHQLVQKNIENEPVDYVLQLEQKGTAHAVLQCREMLKDFHGDVLILYGDVPLTKVSTLSSLLNVHNKHGAWSTILTTDLPDPTGYGRIIRNVDNSLEKIVEEQDASNQERAIREINSGIYVFNSQKLFKLLPEVGKKNSQNEYYLPDVLNISIFKKEKVAIEKINNYFEIQGVNNTIQLNEINQNYKNS